MKSKRVISLLLSLLIVSASFGVLALGVFAAPEELTVKWNSGYVGSSTNGSNYINKLAPASDASTYRYTDIILIPKAGTKITFTDSGANFCSSNAYTLSSWTESGALDLSYANYPGASAKTANIQVYDSKSGSVTYTYVTGRDNERIRLCYCCTGNKDAQGRDIYPKVYTEYTGGAGTFVPEKDPVLPGNPIDVKWNDDQYMGSPFDYTGNRYKIGKLSGYILSDVITIPKAGTKLSWSDISVFPAFYVLTVSSWKKNTSGEWEYDPDGAHYFSANGLANSTTESIASNGRVTYTYTTSVDNENIRICFNKNGNSDYPTVYAKESTATGSWKNSLKIASADKTYPISVDTGLELPGKKTDVEWNFGYVGSSYKTGYENQIVNSNSTYLYSDVITLEKAGTTVCFFDSNVMGYDGSSKFSSMSAAAVSHWKKLGNGSWAANVTIPTVSATDIESYANDNFKVYSYTSTKDNEYIRLCYLAASSDASFGPEVFPVYIIEPTDFAVNAKPGELTNIKFTDENGKNVALDVFFPASYTDGEQHRLITVAGDTSSLELLRAASPDAVIAFCDAADAISITDKLVKGANIRPNDLYLVGLPDEAKRYGDIFVNSAAKISTAAEASALLSKKVEYYNSLDGITLYAMGDSYFEGSGLGRDLTWPALLAAKYGMNFINYGIGGSTVSDFITTKNPMCVRYTTMESGKPDIILLEGGRNDRSNKIPFGTLDTRDTKTFCGALNTIIDGFRKKYPDALIICITAWNYRDSNGATNGYAGTTEAYAKKMIELVDHINDSHVKVINMADPNISGVDMNNAKFISQYSIKANDISHLGIKGHKLVLGKIEGIIADYYAGYRGIAAKRDETVIEPSGTDTTKPSDDTSATTPSDTSGNTPTETTAGGDTTKISDKEGGCGSAVLMPIAVITVFGAGVVTKKSKKK